MYRKTAAALVIILVSSTVNAESMLDCSRLEAEQERLECYDRVAGRVEEKLEESFSGTTEDRVEARNESITEAIVGETADSEVPNLLRLEIKKVIRDRNRRVTYQTVDGRFFRRSTGSNVTFKSGDICVIEVGAFSATFLVREDGKRNKVKELSVK